MILLRADAHNHPHARNRKRMEECLDAFAWTYQVAADRGIKDVVDLGDVFHERSYVDIYTHSEVYRIAKEAKKKYGIKTYWILGNHDMYFRYSRRSSSIVSFEGLGPVISKPTTMDIAGVPIDLFPYVEDTPGPELAASFPRDQRSKILLFHAAIENAIMHSKSGFKREIERNDVEDLHEDEVKEAIAPQFMDGWQVAYGGHYHHPHVVTTDPCHIEYVGSTLQHTYGEEGEKKRVIVLDPETLKAEDVYNDISPRFITVDLSNGDDLKEKDVNNCRVRLITGDVDLKEGREAKKTLMALGAINVITISKKQNRVDKEMHRTGIQHAVAWVQDGKGMVRRYAKLQDATGLDKSRLVEIGERIVELNDSKIGLGDE